MDPWSPESLWHHDQWKLLLLCSSVSPMWDHEFCWLLHLRCQLEGKIETNEPHFPSKPVVSVSRATTVLANCVCEDGGGIKEAGEQWSFTSCFLCEDKSPLTKWWLFEGVASLTEELGEFSSAAWTSRGVSGAVFWFYRLPSIDLSLIHALHIRGLVLMVGNWIFCLS